MTNTIKYIQRNRQSGDNRLSKTKHIRDKWGKKGLPLSNGTENKISMWGEREVDLYLKIHMKTIPSGFRT